MTLLIIDLTYISIQALYDYKFLGVLRCVPIDIISIQALYDYKIMV